MTGIMKLMPFLSVCYMIAGFASLGLPGLSGFVAEMTIFVGAFQNTDIFHRSVTILAASSIVITAVYILRVVAKILLGPAGDNLPSGIKDAVWNEKVVTIILIVAIAGMGLVPLWLSDMILNSLGPITEKLALIK